MVDCFGSLVLAALPLLTFVALMLCIRRRSGSLRYAFLAATTLWACYLAAVTEGLSLVHWLTRTGIALAWAGAAFAAAIAFWRAEPACTCRKQTPQTSDFNSESPQNSILDRAMLGAIGGILLLIALTALLSPPNGSDQVEYHMPRIFEWVLRQSIAFFPTHYYNQLYPSPLAEWAMLHFYVLWGGDRLVNMVQWFAYGGCAVAASLIAAELGAARRGQILAALAAVTVPAGILEASGAKNDLVVAFWIVAATALILAWRSAPTWGNTLLIGAAIGAAVLTKGTAYIIVPPVCAACLFLIPSHLRARFLARLPVVAILVLAINTPHWTRNYRLAGSPLGLPAPDSAGRNRYAVDHYTLGSMAASVVKKTALHFGMPGEHLNAEMTDFFRRSVRLLGEDPDDPTMKTPTSRFRIPQFNRNEYWAGNPLHLMLIAFACVAALLARRRLPPGAAIFVIALFAVYVLLAVMTRWTVDAARLQMPFFMLGAAIVGVVVAERFPRAVAVVAVLMVIAALPFVLLNEERPLIAKNWLGVHGKSSAENVFTSNRERLLFVGDEEYTESSIAAVSAAVAGDCTDIGLDTSEENFIYEGIDYPLMRLAQPLSQTASVRYVNVENLSRKYETPRDRQQPCSVICVHCGGNAAKAALYAGNFPEAATFGDIVVFRPAANEQSSRQNATK